MPLKILHILSQRPDATGSGFFVQNMLRQSAARGHENYLLCGVPAGDIPVLDCIDRDRCSFVLFDGPDLAFPIPGMSDAMPYPSSVFGMLTEKQLLAYEQVFSEKIRHAATEFAPDIIHSHHLWLVTAITRRILPDIPMVASCHSTDLRQFMQCGHLRSQVYEDCRKVERVLALSRDQSRMIQSLYQIDGRRIDIVGGGFNRELFDWGPKEATPIHLLYAGKLSFAKGVDWLLRACRHIAGLPVHLHLAGSGAGHEAEVCRALAAELEIPVQFHGNLPQAQLAVLMRAAHIFILPSFYEGFPLVLLEALASGCRIITTRLPGGCELLENVRSDLVQFINLPPLQTVDRPFPDDWQSLEEQLADAIRHMVDLAQKTPAPTAAETNGLTVFHTWEGVFSRVMAAYSHVLSRGG
ncbi:glycosyltransferase family 4 protein [Geobacter sp. FeAm09]|uniref:glycosyltransferase family 4 protein n=1 Tax=Geobacter sp. FeAm09 TaxID=2597769 RepID=UPI00143D7484|nr:glycosyltransferase family 4 protein [Geobacter sp. FeAm09]